MQIEPGSRDELNALSFLSALADEGGYKMRPASYLTTQTVRLLDMALGKGKEVIAGTDPDQLQDEINAYLFIQAAPGPTAERGVRAFRKALKVKTRADAWDDFMCEFVAPFLGTLAPKARADLEAQLEQLDESDAAVVDAHAPPGQRGERPDPNS